MAAKHWVGCPTEEEFFGEERKRGKVERKLAKAKDRSQYKKTDREKFKKSDTLHKNIKKDRSQLLHGRVLSITPQGILVDSKDGSGLFTCTLRGLLKKEKVQFKNLVTVGDFVLFEKSSDNEGLIAHVEPRHSILSRADNLSRRKEQLIAANIDQVLITVSVVNPPLKPFLVDRYIIATHKGNMTPIIIINKIDLLENDNAALADERLLFQEMVQAYKDAGIALIPVSAATGEGMDLLEAAMKDKASVFSGQSGVGKSSLINATTSFNLKVGGMVDKTKKGSHTTTTASLLQLPFGGWCIDTPGIKSFGIWDLKKDEVEQYFTEIYAQGRKCKFLNCSHLHESGCEVIKAVEEGKIALFRYQSYHYLVESISQSHVRR